jgi:hypothetical protein
LCVSASFSSYAKIGGKMTGMNPVFQSKNSLEKSLFCCEISLKFLAKIKFFEIVFCCNLLSISKETPL